MFTNSMDIVDIAICAMLMFAMFILAQIQEIVLPGDVPVEDEVDCVTLKRYLSFAGPFIKDRAFLYLYIHCDIASHNDRHPLRNRRLLMEGLLG